MARVTAQDFVGTRARFQRLSDAKIFNGWIERIFGNKIELSTRTDSTVAAGDQFRVEAFGHFISMVFTAELEETEVYDVISQNYAALEEGGTATVQTTRLTFQMGVKSSVRFSASSEPVRVQVPELPICLNQGETNIDGIVVDVAPNGMGVVSPERFEVDQQLEICMETSHGEIKGTCNVRYCKPDIDRDGFYRTGLMFVDLGRIERPRWERFLKQIN